jgi:pimeloyl-ACP methyl ester carboxylesterase
VDAAVTHHIMRTPAGRAIGISGLGDPASRRLVLFCHPSPGASGFDPDPVITNASGLRLMSLDRPGYGATDPDQSDAGRAWIDDVHELLRIVRTSAEEATDTDYGTTGVIGWGIGCVHAAALAANHPALVDRLALVAPPAASSSPILDPVLLGDGEGEARHPGFNDRRIRMLENAATGQGGREYDRRMVAGDWPGHLGSIDAATLIVHAHDRRSRADASWYRDRIPRARTREFATSPEYLIADAWPAVIDQVRVRGTESPGSGCLEQEHGGEECGHGEDDRVGQRHPQHPHVPEADQGRQRRGEQE